LQPAKIDPTTLHTDYKNKKSRVMLKPDQIKYAIGKNGNNIHLAERLTGFEIEIYREIDKSIEDSDDIDIIAFREDFGDDMIYQLLDNGLDTAKKVLDAGIDAIEQALIISPRREDPLDALKMGRTPRLNTRIISEDERKHWRRTAENIYKSIKAEFDEHTVDGVDSADGKDIDLAEAGETEDGAEPIVAEAGEPETSQIASEEADASEGK
jgi:transcription termination/antitermination protein NusA